ncbi:dipeptidyl peptidase 9-like [Argiope bruennichi]|uniref:dipeptidyl peptidase 9-like n=1 Tax=Argiope bruennichi TaxID=94029 RepID=UPI00249558BC|nr:dipeptidyl peptidase 9-like [Argiope bruennichi]XP_055945967.1 dipeptidyl peptidase 9-like [Argiope bruennichi]
MEVDASGDEVNNHRKSNGKKKTWTELKKEVRNVRRQLSSISSKIPSYFEFKEMVAENETRFCRIYFLSTLASGRETTLLYCDVPFDYAKSKIETFPWQPLLESSFQAQGHFSREEQMQMERKRCVIWGITSFDYQPSIGRFVFPASGSVFYCDDQQTQTPLHPHELEHFVSINSHLNPQMCPWNPDLIAYINNCDLWVHHIISCCDVRLTYARKGSTDLSEEPLSAGIPSYITQEEFNRYTGFWWQPVSIFSGGDIYHILYEEVDESQVELLYLPCFADEKEVEIYRFPRAGTKNAKSTLKIAQFRVTATNEIEVLPYLQLSDNITSLCPDIEYLVRAGWTPDGKHVWAKVLDRKQSHEQLLLLPFSSFVSSDPTKEIYANHIESNPVAQVIYEEVSDVWINVTDVLYFFTQEIPNEITFLWASEETGFRHLYIVTVELLMANECKINHKGTKLTEVSKRIKKKIALTSGEWEVSESDIWVNEKKRLVYFIGLKDSPLERHLYVVDIDNPHEPLRLTASGFSHSVAMNDDCTLFVTIQSSVGQPHFGQVYQICYSPNNPFTVQALGYFIEPSALPSSYRQPELFSHRLQSGHLIYGMLFKPPNMRVDEKYPTVLTIYGGPEVQLVTNSYKGMRYLRQYLLSSEGYVVVSIDCRGSRHRGVAFESHIKSRMGTVEIADQVEVLLWLSETTGIIDLDRVAVHGWSYGGYLSLMGLIQRPDIFKVAVAGAPVTSWTLYDTGYTERYMGTPERNATGYSTGSVIDNANRFPDEENRLLIIHGLRDENVHFAHTSQLINALIKAGKPYQLQIYPTERHSLRHLDTSEHYETTLLSFLQQHL